MKKVFLLLLVAASASAQTISPLTSECSKKCSGSFTIKNNGLRPLTVTLEKKGFTVSKDGTPTLTPLPQGIEVELGASSAVVPIAGTHTFFFKMKCDELPCHAQILALMSSGDRLANSGLKLALGLPHVVYACERKENCRLNTLRNFGYDPTLAAKK